MQLRNILAAVDASPTGAHALRTAAQLATAADAVLTVLTVVENEGGPTPRDVEQLRGFVQTAVVPGRAVHRVGFGVPAIEIPRWADDQAADMIVLGRASRTWLAPPGVSRTIVGTVRRACVPCFVAPLSQLAYRRVLAAVDAGPTSADVLAAAFALAELLDAQVAALHVEREPSAADAGLPRWATMQHAESLVAAVNATWARESGDAAGGLRATLTSCDVMVRQGEPVGEILKTVHAEATDLLVVGHHRGGPAQGGAGSVAPRLLERTASALLTVPL